MNAVVIDSTSPNPLTDSCVPLTEQEFADAYTKNFRRTVRFLASGGAGLDAAEEIAQAAWARGWESRAQLRHAEALNVWINSIAKNLLHSYYRRMHSSSELAESMLVGAPTPPSTMDIERLVSNCTDSERNLLNLYYVEGYTSKELSVTFGLSAVGVRVRLTRLKQNLAAKASQRAGADFVSTQRAA
ncbi:sigma-70 family RNA polymerase sigma factor [Bryobacter aggregatus]|uniref:sigma-70 family RNA polymerase sigma factor n=1 Tax=Bryobacter aggregatus TaxID=360054 RepID=UPI0012BABEAB|nr:sigma-70 family RNA polymerase sigma factor [Bryobacter aggregatus]